MSTRARSSTLHLLFLLGVIASSSSAARPARAALPPDDEPSPIDTRLDRRDEDPHELWAASQGTAPPIWLALQLGAARGGDGDHSLSGMLLVSIPLEGLAERRRLPRSPSALAEAQPKPTLRPPPGAQMPAEGPTPLPRAAPADPPPSQEPAVPLPVRISPEVARAAVRAALKRARLADPDAGIDAVASRARYAALLPELRLRISRLVDEAESLAPTEYDPTRRTASGGTSLWLEARATWRLDRAVFADEEIALERMRQDRADAQAKLAARVLEMLFAWRRDLALEADPSRTPEQRRESALAANEAEATLDLVTDGWFARWRAGSAPPADRTPRASSATKQADGALPRAD